MSTPKLAPGSFKRLSAAFMLDTELGKPAMRVGMYLAYYADNDTHECRHSTTMMASGLRMARSAVIEGLKQLVARGHVQRRRRSAPGRGQISSVYILVFKALPTPEFCPPGHVAGDNGGTPPAQRDSPGKALVQSASLDRSIRSPASGVLANWSVGREPVTGFLTAGDQYWADPVTYLTGHVLDSHSRILRLDADVRAPSHEAPVLTGEGVAEDDALLIFDEMAQRLGWIMAVRLTNRERKALTARLIQCNGLDGWRLAMKKAEASNYLRRTRPGLSFFLSEDGFAQLLRGRYDPENDPPQGNNRFQTALERTTRAIDCPSKHVTEAPAVQRMQRELPPTYVRQYDAVSMNLKSPGKREGQNAKAMVARANHWLDQLVGAGLQRDEAREVVTVAVEESAKAGGGIADVRMRGGSSGRANAQDARAEIKDGNASHNGRLRKDWDRDLSYYRDKLNQGVQHPIWPFAAGPRPTELYCDAPQDLLLRYGFPSSQSKRTLAIDQLDRQRVPRQGKAEISQA